MYPILPVSLDCPFLTTPSVFSIGYLPLQSTKFTPVFNEGHHFLYMFACVDSFIYMFFSFIFFLSCHIVCLCVLFDDLFILAFVSTVYCFTYIRDRRGRYRMVVRLKTTYVISVCHLRLSISNPVQDDVYSIQPCVIKFVSGLLQVVRFHPASFSQ